MNYTSLSREFRPDKIRILLIGEAPPPNGKTYFYLIPKNYKPKGRIDKDQSLPATIFNHYFGKRPDDSLEYEAFLHKLRENEIFLIDMIEEPIRIRDKNGIIKENIDILLSDKNIEALKNRIKSHGHEETKVIFLLARRNYKKRLKMLFEDSEFITWKDFRTKKLEILT